MVKVTLYNVTILNIIKGDNIMAKKPNFDFNGTDKYYFKSNKMITHFFNALSATFPAGEQFFVRSVRRYRTYEKTDLEARISQFMQEEAFHTIAHDTFNKYAETYGVPILDIQNKIDVLLKFVEKHSKPIHCLAITVALEHYTSEMGLELLRTDRWLGQMDDELAKLYRYHAEEESSISHRSAAFDVYEHVGGRHIDKCIIMAAATIILWFLLALITINFMVKDKDMSKLDMFLETKDGLYELLNNDYGFLHRSFKHIPKFFSRKFHPSKPTK